MSEEGFRPSPAVQTHTRVCVEVICETEERNIQTKKLRNEDGSTGVVWRRGGSDEIEQLLRLIRYMLSRGRLRNPFKRIVTMRFHSAINGAGKLVLRRYVFILVPNIIISSGDISVESCRTPIFGRDTGRLPIWTTFRISFRYTSFFITENKLGLGIRSTLQFFF